MNSAEFIKSAEKNLDFYTRPYIIAEAGVNHEGDMDNALRLIDEAKEGGAHAIKFQSYKAETLASKNSPSYWDTSKESTTSQYSLFKKYDSFWKKEYEQLKLRCDSKGIEFLSTPFDFESAKFLNDLMPTYKISSSDITNFPFIEYICSFGKPILLSTGASTMNEVIEADELIAKTGNPLSLLHCILNYPTLDENANLGIISDLRRTFPKHVIGYSDHTLPDNKNTLVAAALLGAKIIEKHFTFDKTLPGNDHYHAMDKDDLKEYTRLFDELDVILGSSKKVILDSEVISRKNARRSIVAAVDIPRGTIVTREMLTFKRPGTGISPKHIDQLIGQPTSKDIQEDDLFDLSFIGTSA